MSPPTPAVTRRVLAYLSDHPRPTAAELAIACATKAEIAARVAKIHKIRLSPPQRRTLPRLLLTREEYFAGGKQNDEHILETHEELMLHFREFARARGIPWRVAMTEAMERWMRSNVKRVVVDQDAAGNAHNPGVLVPERTDEAVQLLLHSLRR